MFEKIGSPSLFEKCLIVRLAYGLGLRFGNALLISLVVLSACSVKGPQPAVDYEKLLVKSEQHLGPVVYFEHTIGQLRSRYSVGGECRFRVRTSLTNDELKKELVEVIRLASKVQRPIRENDKRIADDSILFSLRRIEDSTTEIIVQW